MIRHQHATVALLSLILAMAAVSNSNADIVLSFLGHGEGDANVASHVSLNVGDEGIAYIWVSDDTKVDTGAFLDIVNSNTSAIQFTAATAFNPDIVSGGSMVDRRWQAVNNGTVSGGLIDELSGIRFFDGTGILPSQVTGSAIEDSLHDATSSAFLFGSVNFVAVGRGNAEFSAAIGDGLIVDEGVAINPTFRSASVSVSAVPEPSGSVMLLIAFGGFLMRRSRQQQRVHLS